MISPKNQVCLIPLYFLWAVGAHRAGRYLDAAGVVSISHSLGAEARVDFAALNVRAKACTLQSGLDHSEMRLLL
jgi:hypothetical protein